MGGTPSGHPHESVHEKAARVGRSSLHVGGYVWFMSLGTFLPLPIFLAGYVFEVTIVLRRIAALFYRLGYFTTTLGQAPPAQDKMNKATHKASGKRSLRERLRPYTPPAFVERHGRPYAFWQRALWFALAGWWLGAIWVGVAWSFFLLPYPLLAQSAAVLAELPTVMHLGVPDGTLVRRVVPSVYLDVPSTEHVRDDDPPAEPAPGDQSPASLGS